MIQRILVSVLALAAAAGTASATILTYNSQGTLESVNNDLTFQNISFAAYVGQSGLTSITAGGVTFTATSGTFSVLSNTLLQADTGGTTIQISLGSTVRAFGLNFAYLGGAPWPTDINFTGDGSASNNNVSAPAFFGARVSNNVDGLITGLTVSNGFNARIQLSSFEIGTAADPPPPPPSEAPESATLVLIGAGLVAMGWKHRKSRVVLA